MLLTFLCNYLKNVLAISQWKLFLYQSLCQCRNIINHQHSKTSMRLPNVPAPAHNEPVQKVQSTPRSGRLPIWQQNWRDEIISVSPSPRLFFCWGSALFFPRVYLALHISITGLFKSVLQAPSPTPSGGQLTRPPSRFEDHFGALIHSKCADNSRCQATLLSCLVSQEWSHESRSANDNKVARCLVLA